MDKRIIWLALIILLVVGAIFTYRYYSKGKKKTLDKINFKVGPKQIFAGESVNYEDYSVGVITRQWDFGDGSPLTDSISGNHTYDVPNTYNVKLKINNSLTDSITIVVNSRTEEPLGLKPEVSEKERTVFVGEQVTFVDKTEGAEHTIWTNNATGEIVKNKKQYTTVFTSWGDFTILVQNEKNKGSNGQTSINVHVKRKPDPVVRTQPQPTPPKPAPPSPKPSGGQKPKDPVETAVEKKDPPAPAALPPAAPKKAPVTDSKLMSYFNDIATHPKDRKLYSSVYDQLNKELGSLSIPVYIYSNGVQTDKKDISSFCKDLYIMHSNVVSVSSQWDENFETMKKMTVHISEK